MFDLFDFFAGMKKNSRGAISLVIVITILGVILVIALGSSFITSSGLRISSDYSDSVIAYYAAETGMERALFEIKTQEPLASRCGAGWTPADGAQYCLKITQTTPGDYTTITGIQSIGEHRSVRRSIEINF